MSKSKYPNQIDTPSELPIVRDNIFEIGSDAINSLRSAIIQIEKTLGINPNGAVGLTVGERISQSLDPSGNIKREALDRAGLISGLIFDDQVSDSAAIKESKIKLNFPTHVLQSQISVTASLIDEIQSQIEQISAKLSAHLSPDAANRHSAKSISTTEIAATGSESGIRSLSASNVQAALESIFDSHINYDGTLISDVNNSHSANQIYFDNSTTNIVSEDVQGAIEEVADYLQTQVVQHQNLFHGAGSSKSSLILDKNDINYGTILINSVTSSVYRNLGEKPYFEILLDSPVLASEYNISTGDYVELTVNAIAKEYQIYKVDLDTTKENILGFWLFGTFETNEVLVPTIVFSRRFRKKSNFGLLSGVRENYGYSSSNIIQVINLDAPYIESFGINTNEISISNRFFDLKINGTQYSFDVYNSSLTVQSIDSVIKKINETVDYLSLPILAFRVDKENIRSEIVIAHNISSKDDADSSLEIVRVDGAIDTLGLSSYENRIVYGEPGSSYYIGGERYTGLLKKLDLTGFDIQAGSRNINSGALAIDFISYGIKKGDIVNVIDSGYMNCYEITNVASSYISISPRQLPSGFPTAVVGSARLIIYDSSINISNSEFLKIGTETSSTNGSSLFEVFFDKNRNINTNLILEQESEIYASKSIYQILDFKDNTTLTSFQLNFETINSELTTYIWLDGSDDKKKIVGNNNYIKLKSNTQNFECDIFVPDSAALYGYAYGVGGSFSKTVFLNSKINRENNLVISNIHYSNTLGKFDGGINGSLSVSKLNIGNIEEKDISTALKATLTELPIMELRSYGVVGGLKVSAGLDTDGYSMGSYIVSIEGGVCYIEGKRFEVSAVENFNSGIDSALYDKVYIGIDENGNFVFSGPDPICLYPWSEEKILLLATIENRSTYYDIIDQRLFIDNLDLKLLNSITVSQQPGMGHFTNIQDAIRYAKRFSEIFPKAGIPEVHIKSGIYRNEINIKTNLTSSTDWQNAVFNTSGTSNSEKTNYFNEVIRSGIYIDFPISISGEGDGTKIEVEVNLELPSGNIFVASGIHIFGGGFNSSGLDATLSHGKFNNGTLNIEKIYFLNSNILIFDLVNKNTNNYLSINKVYANEIFFYELSDTITTKGNVSILNSVFTNSIKFLPNTSASRYNRISLSQNYFRGNETSNPSLLYTGNFSPSKYISAFGNTVKTVGGEGVRDRAIYDLQVPHNIYVENDIFSNNDATIVGATTSGSFFTNTNSGSLRAIPISDFYAILQESSGTYTHSGAVMISSIAGIESAPVILRLYGSGSGTQPHIMFGVDPYIINGATRIDVKIVGSTRDAPNADLVLEILSMPAVGTTAMSLITTSSQSVSSYGRKNLLFSLNTPVSKDNLIYLNLVLTTAAISDFNIYRVSIISYCDNNIEKMINIE